MYIARITCLTIVLLIASQHVSSKSYENWSPAEGYIQTRAHEAILEIANNWAAKEYERPDYRYSYQYSIGPRGDGGHSTTVIVRSVTDGIETRSPPGAGFILLIDQQGEIDKVFYVGDRP